MIMEGEASAFKTIDGHKKEVMQYHPGDYFGERALLKNEPWAASVVAKSSPTKVMTLDWKSFNRMLGPIDEILSRNMETYKKFVS